MHLKLTEGNTTHLSHFHHFVSAWESTEERIDDLERMISEAVDKAKEVGRCQVVDQDNMTHIFLIFPNGSISLYREVGHYEIINDVHFVSGGRNPHIEHTCISCKYLQDGPQDGGWCKHRKNKVSRIERDSFMPSVSSTGGCDLWEQNCE